MDTGIADTSATHVSADTGYNGYSCIADTIVCAYLLKGGIRDCIHGSGCIHATPGYQYRLIQGQINKNLAVLSPSSRRTPVHVVART